MSQSQSLAPLVCGVASAVFCVAIVLIAPDLVHAEAQRTPAGPSTCSCPERQEPDVTRPVRPRFADLNQRSTTLEETATLEALHLTLSEVGDGASYVWHDRTGSISGVITPTASFKDTQGQLCRHIVVSLSRESRSRRAEGVACRLTHGGWQLDG